MQHQSICLIGLGRMGFQVAKKLPEVKQLVFIEKNPSKRVHDLAIQRGAHLVTSIERSIIPQCFVLALNPNDIDRVIDKIPGHVGNESTLINLSTSRDIISVPGRYKSYNIKIIGEADAICHENLPYIIIPENLPASVRNLIKTLFGQFGKIIEGKIAKYKSINRIVARETIQSINNIIVALKNQDIPKEIIQTCIRNLMAGTCSGYPWSTSDDFIVSLLKDMNVDYNELIM